MTLEVLDPRGYASADEKPCQERPSVRSLVGVPVSILDNSKPGFDVFAEALVDDLVRRFGVVDGLHLAKPDASHAAQDEWYDLLVDTGGIAVVGWGD